MVLPMEQLTTLFPDGSNSSTWEGIAMTLELPRLVDPTSTELSPIEDQTRTFLRGTERWRGASRETELEVLVFSEEVKKVVEKVVKEAVGEGEGKGRCRVFLQS